MALTLNDLEKKGAFPAERLVKKSVAWIHTDEQGKELVDQFDIFIKVPTVAEINSLYSKENENKNYQSSMISTCLRLGDKGEERLDYEKAMQLDASLSSKLFTEIMSLISLDGEGVKKSEKKTKSGMN